MEDREMEREKVEEEVPWIPNTPVKLTIAKSAPICTPAEESHLDQHSDEAVACGAEKDKRPCDDVSVPAADIAGDSGKDWEEKASGNVFSGWSKFFVSSEFSFPVVEMASANSCATEPGNNDSQDNQETSENACCSTALTPDDSIKAESTQSASTQVNMEENDTGKEVENVPAEKLDNNGAPPNLELNDSVMEFSAVSSPLKENQDLDKGSSQIAELNQTPPQKPKRRKHRPKVIREGKPKSARKPVTPKPVQPKENSTGKRKYVRKTGLNKTSTPPTEVTGEFAKELPEPAKMSCRRSLNFDIEARDESCAGGESATAVLNVDLACDLNASVKQASTGSKQNSAGKRKYVRKTGLNKTSSPPAEVTGEFDKEVPESAKISCGPSLNFDIEARDESCVGGESVTAVLNVDLPSDLNASVKQASTGSKQNSAGKRKYVRKTGLSKTYTPPAEVTGEFAKEVPESAKISCGPSLNFDIEARDESCAGGESATAVLNVDLPSDLNASVKQASTGSKENSTGKRKYVRKTGLNKTSTPPAEVTGEFAKEVPESAKISCRPSLNFDIEAGDECCAGGESETAVLNVDLACDLNASVKQASTGCVSLPEATQASNTSPSQRTCPGAKPRDKTASKRKYVRKTGLNKTSAPPTEVTGEESQASKESFAVKENATIHQGKEIGVVTQEMSANLAYDLDISMEQASNIYKLLAEGAHATNTSSGRNPHEAKPKENQTAKRKRVRSGLKKSSTPTEVTGELIKEMVPKSAKTSCRKSLNFDEGARDESSADRDNAKRKYVRRKGVNKSPTTTVMAGEMTEAMMTESKNLDGHVGKEKNEVVEETPAGLAYTEDAWMRLALNNCTSLPGDKLAVSSSPSECNPPGAKPREDPACKRTYVRKKGQNKSPAPTVMTGELTEPIMPGTTIISCTSPAHDKNTLVNEALYNCISLAEDNQAVTFLSNSNPLEAMLNANSQDGNISNGQLSTIMSQMVGSKRNQSGTIKCADYSSMNLIGAHYNGLPSYKSQFPVQFPNVQRKRRTEKGKTSDTHVTSYVTPEKELQLAYSQEDAQDHLYASNSSCLIYGSGYNAAIIPGISASTANVIGNTQMNDEYHEYLLSLRRLTERSRFSTQTWDCNSLMTIRNCDSEQNYGVKQLGISNWLTFGDADTPETCIGALVAEKEVSLAKNKRNRKKDAPSSSSYPSTNEMQQNQSLVLRNHFLPLGESSDVAPVKRNRKKGTPSSSACPSTNEMQQNQNLVLINHFLPLGESSDIAPVKRNRKKGAPSSSAYPSTNEMQQNQNLVLRNHFLPLGESSDVAPVKRNRKRGAPSSSAYPSTNEMQQNHNLALRNYFLPSGKSSDVGPMCDVETLAEQFRQLNINTEARDLALLEQNALVPFQGSFDPIKKHFPRPKVDIDEETDKVWKLLMLDINSHGVDGTDEDKAKWWEEERNVFRGRADSFIARMHLVQGDRRFSRWKGSVVDSVVGVFLTQNVSDHLSSSAYMSLAARYPPKPSSMRNHGEGTTLVVNEPQVQIVEPEESTEWDVKLLNQSVHDQSSMTIDLAKHSGEKEAVNSDDSCRITSSVISLTDESNCRLPESSQRNIKEHHSPMRSGLISTSIEELEEKSCYDSAGLESNVVSSQCSVITSQISGDSSNDQNPEKIGSSSDSNSEIEDLSSTAMYNSFYSGTSFSKLLEIVSSTKFHEVNSERSKSAENLRDTYSSPTESLKIPNAAQIANTNTQTIASQVHPQEQSSHMQHSFFNISEQTKDLVNKERRLNLGDHKDTARSETNEISSAPIKSKSREQGKEKQEEFDWDRLRITAQAKAGKRERTENTMDTLDWDAVRCADVNEIANTIKERGMNNRLAERIQGFLNRLVEKHGSIDLEWLRDVPPDQAKEYLLSFRGLGLKSVECVRLLTLHHLAFPVDTNVGRIAVRLGWVPLQPLPESLQLHLLEMYPVLESIQKYLWPRLCKLDQRTLYELHYQMITFGKVFCTKSKPNCNACPMRAECRHFASAFASARLSLPGPEQKSIVTTAGSSVTDQNPSVLIGNNVTDQNPSVLISQLRLSLPENTNQAEEIHQTEESRQIQLKAEINICQPIIEEPKSPEPECSQVYLSDIEDAFNEDSCEIPTIKLNIEEFTLNLQNYIQQNMELQEGEMSKALVSLDQQAASIPMPKLKNMSRLRTEHCVYELPDTHPLLEGWDMREPDDPGKYLLAIWTPGETANSIQPPENKCSSQEECGQLCSEKECFSCNSFREANSQIVRGTILIPCRTAMRGSFPLNGTYFQVNEVFADHDSSHDPISVPRSWIWNLTRRTVYFGTSIPTIFKGLSTQDIQQCFWRGYVCVRGFDRISRAPRPLMARLHMPASKLPKPQPKEKTKKEPKEKTKKESGSAKEKTKKGPKEKTNKESSSAKGQGPEPNPELLELVSNSDSHQKSKTA